MEELSFNVGDSYQDSTSQEYAKAIIGLIAAGLDPTNYNEKDYVEFLVSSQTEEGYFETKDDSGDKADDLAYSILSLDMAGAEYDVAKAVNRLKDKFTIEGDKAYVKEWSWNSSGDLELTAISLIALSNHKDIIDMDLIDKAINYIKSERFESGMYGKIDWGQEKVSASLTSKMVQTLAAVGETIPDEIIDGLLNLKSGNEFKESESSYNEYSTTEVFAALTDVYTGKSMFKATDIKEPARVEIILPEGQDSIKAGKKMQLSAKAYDKNGKYIASQNYVWSSDKLEVATIDEKGVVTGHKIGTATINVKVSGFENVEKSIQIDVVGVEPNSIDLKVDGDLSEIEVGRKVKIDAEVLDADKQKVEKTDIQWEITPKDLAELDDKGILTALKPGNVTITASVQKNEEETLSESINLKIVTKQEKIDKALEEVKDGIMASDGYEYTTAMGLRLTGINVDDIAEKTLKYSYTPNTNTRAKDIMMAIAIGKDPKNYHDKNYVQEILDSDFYNNENPEWLANGIIALDMAGAKYDEVKAVNALINKLENGSGKYYIKNKSNDNPNPELTSLTLIALSKHSDIDGVNTAIEGIKNYLKSIQDENGLIENCKNHSLAIQALIASGEDIYSDEWTKQDELGNTITLLDALLSLKEGFQFKVLPDNKYPKSGQEVYAFAALVDISTNKSMYHEVKYTGPKGYTIQIETDSKDLIINQGETIKLEAKVLENGSPVDKEIIWESLNDNIVQVQDGEIKALKEGQTKVRSKIKFFEDIYDEVNITVNKVIGKPERIAIKKIDNVPVIKGANFKLEADVLDNNGNILENNDLEWTSSNLNIASVDERGNVIAHKAGSVEISVKVKNTNIKDTITIVIFDNEKDANNTVQTKEGGFKERGESPVPLNTGYALKALSKHRDYDGVNESINKALNYLESIQKDDGGFYTTTYITGYNAKVISGLLAVGEDLTSERWTKGNSNPIESLFILWKDNKSFDNKEGESENNRGWIDATQKALYTLVDLKEAGYSNYVVKTANISDKPEEPEEVLDVYTSIVVDKGNGYEIYSKPKEVTINTKEHSAGLTALGSLQATTPLYTAVGGYVEEIFGIKGKGVGGWIYAVNDKMPNVNPDKVNLKEGDKVVWFYSPKGMDGKIPSWEEILEINEDDDHREFEIEDLSKAFIVNEKHTKLKYKLTNLTNETKEVKFVVGLYDKKTDKLVNYSLTNKKLKPEESIEIETIFLIPSKGEYYIKSFVLED